MSTANALDHLAEASNANRLARRAETAAVLAARKAGATWQEVATATGLASRQAAQARWGAFQILENDLIIEQRPLI